MTPKRGVDGGPDVDELPLCLAGRADRVEVRWSHQRHLHLGVRREPRRAAAALLKGQAAAMGRRRPHRLVVGPRPRKPDAARRLRRADLRLAYLGAHDREGASPAAAPSAGLANLAIHAWRT